MPGREFESSGAAARPQPMLCAIFCTVVMCRSIGSNCKVMKKAAPQDWVQLQTRLTYRFVSSPMELSWSAQHYAK